MPSLTTFRIEFDRPGATYTPGETVSGNIIVHLSKEKHFRKLNLSVKGEANVLWHVNKTEKDANGRSRTRTQSYSSSERYFSSTYLILGGDRSDDRVNIPVGYHQYGFSFQLPMNIPSSFEHRYGYIRYTAKAVIDRPWKFDHECKAAFTVISPLDLNNNRHECLAISDDISKNFCFLCCISNGSLSGTIRVPATGLVPGQSIDVLINFDNSASSVAVTKICTKLEQTLKFHAKSPTGAVKTETSEIKGVKSTGPFGRANQVHSPILIPPIPPSRLEHCRIIDQEYYLKVCIHLTGCHFKIERKYPILIGTVPLCPYPSAPPASNLMESSGAPTPLKTDAAYGYATGGIAANLRNINSTIATSSAAGSSSMQDQQWNIPPPSYEECIAGAQQSSIRDEHENEYVHGANKAFIPRYPVFSMPSTNTEKRLGMNCYSCDYAQS